MGHQERSGDESTMMVVACTADGGVRVHRRPVPSPGPGELVLDLRACGLCGTDLFKLANATELAGTVLGHEIVGEVAAVGEGTVGFAKGDRLVVPHHVACGGCPLCRRGAATKCEVFLENLLWPGGFSEKVLVRPRAVSQAAFRVPDGVGDAQACFVEPAACVLRGVRKAGLQPSEGCAVVLGAGTMGLLHLLVLRVVRPGVQVVVCDPMEDRQAKAMLLGARAACAPRPDELEAAVAEASNGVGADAVFDTVGGAGPMAVGLGSCRPGGTAVLFAHAAEGEVAGFELNAFFKAEHRVVATYSGALDEQQRIAELIFSGVLDPETLVSHRLPLSRFAEAVELSMSRRAYKVLLEPDP